jgi:DNA-binding transcriptional MerR regulator
MRDDLNEPQAAGLLGCSASTLRRYRRAGLIGYNRTPGGRVSYSMAQLAEFKVRCVVNARAASGDSN